MTEIIISRQHIKTPRQFQQCGIDSTQLHCKNAIAELIAYQPYVLNPHPSRLDQSIANTLCLSRNPHNLLELSTDFGPNDTVALSETMAKLHEYQIALAGASTSVYGDRMGKFVKSVQTYQDELIKFRDAIKSGNGANQAKANASSAYTKMQHAFKHELSAVTANVKSRKGTPLTRLDRGLNIARSSRNIARLNIASTVQAHNLMKFSSYAKHLGNGLAVIDFGSRIGYVHTEYKAGGNWERELFIESSSFAASAATGTIAVKAGLAFLAVATPAGWVGLVVAGTAIAAAAATASMTVNDYTKKQGGKWYDRIMAWLES